MMQMWHKTEQVIERNPGKFSIGITLLLFIIIQLLAVPVLNSGDDAFLMYTLGGGYGEPPSNLLHYNHIWHPALGWVVKSLFSVAPGVNWYAVVILLFHSTGTVLVLYVFLSGAGVAKGLLLFLAFMVFFEIRFLLSPGFTGAAFVAAGGALFYLHYLFARKEPLRWMEVLLPAIILLLAGLLRLQIVWLACLLFLPFAISSLRNSWKKWTLVCFSVIAVLFILNKQQVAFYKKHIPGWEQQEGFRQALFYSYNRPLKQNVSSVFTDSIEMQLYFSGFMYDATRIETQRLQEISKGITRQRWLNESEDREGLYWLFIELRVYLVLFAVFVAGLLLMRKRRAVKNWLLSVLTVAIIYGGLFVFLKMTAPIHTGLITVLFLHLAWYYLNHESITSFKRAHGIIMSLILLFAFAWMGARLVSENRMNEYRRSRFYCSLEELNMDHSKLFIATDDSFPLGYFYVWDIPRAFPAANLLHKDRLLAGTYQFTLERFGIRSVDSSIVKNENVYFLGKRLAALEKIMHAKYSGRFPAYKCLEVRKLLGEW